MAGEWWGTAVLASFSPPAHPIAALAFFHRENRLAGFAMKEIKKTHLGGLGDGRNIPPILPNRDQAGLRGQVIIPNIVMHDLKMPDQLTGGAA
jgi:hypothetical protein